MKKTILIITASFLIIQIILFSTYYKISRKQNNIVAIVSPRSSELPSSSPPPSPSVSSGNLSKPKVISSPKVSEAPVVVPASQTPILQAQAPIIVNPQPQIVIIEPPQIEELPPSQAPAIDRAAIQMQINNLLVEYQATEQRYQQYLEDTTAPIIQALASEYTKRGIPLSSEIYQDAVANAISSYVESNRIDKEAALSNIENQIKYLESQLN